MTGRSRSAPLPCASLPRGGEAARSSARGGVTPPARWSRALPCHHHPSLAASAASPDRRVAAALLPSPPPASLALAALSIRLLPLSPFCLQITTLLELRRRLGCECPRCRLELSIEGERRATLHRTGSVSGRDIGLQRLPGIIAQRSGPTTPTTKKGMVAGARGAGVAPRRSAGSSDRVDQSPDFIDASSQETPMNSLLSGANRPLPPL